VREGWLIAGTIGGVLEAESGGLPRSDAMEGTAEHGLQSQQGSELRQRIDFGGGTLEIFVEPILPHPML